MANFLNDVAKTASTAAVVGVTKTTTTLVNATNNIIDYANSTSQPNSDNILPSVPSADR